MANPSTPPNKLPQMVDPAPKLDFLSGALSYLIPGLGQMAQGRLSKGIVFFVSLYGLFFYGMILGDLRNVYLPRVEKNGGLAGDLYARPHYIGQFFIGVASWPSLVQYASGNKNENPAKKGLFGNFQKPPTAEEINEMQRDSNKSFDLAWVYTVIAGVLNVLVIYDAIAGPAFREIKVRQPATESPSPAETPTGS